MHDVKLWKFGESRALRSVLRNHAEGYALLCFHSYSALVTPQIITDMHTRSLRGTFIFFTKVTYRIAGKFGGH